MKYLIPFLLLITFACSEDVIVESKHDEFVAHITKKNQLKELIERVENPEKIDYVKITGELTTEDVEKYLSKFTKIEYLDIEETNLKHLNNVFSQVYNHLETVKLPKNLETINRSFQNCRNLENISIPKSVREIGDLSLMRCPIKNIELPDGIEYIGDFVLSYTDLTELKIPDNYSGKLSNVANNTLISELIIPKNVSSVYYYMTLYGESEDYYTEDYVCTFMKIIMKSPVPVKSKINCHTALSIHVPEHSVDYYRLHENWGKYRIEGYSVE